MDHRSYGKVNGISINIATWCDLYHLYNTFIKQPTWYSYFLVFSLRKMKKKIIFLKGIKKLLNSKVRRICHVQMNHINTLAIDQSQGFVTYLWEDFNQNTMYNKVNEKTHLKEYKGSSWMRRLQWNWLMYERKLTLVENE